MAASIRTVLVAARDRRRARALDQVTWCDGQDHVCDSACRARSHRDRALAFAPTSTR